MPTPSPDRESPDRESVARLADWRDSLRTKRRWQDALSEQERQQMLAEIATVALAIGSDLYPERGIGDLDIAATPTGAAPCPRERFAFLETAYPQIAAALSAIAASPPAGVTTERAVVFAERVRAAPVRFLPGTAQWLTTRRVPTSVTPANRAVKALLALWRRDIRRIAEVAEATGELGVARRARALEVRFRHWVRTAPWDEIREAGRLAVPMHPVSAAHQSLFRLHRRYAQSFRFDWSDPLFTLPARESWQVYETWGVLAVVGVLKALGFTARDGEMVRLTPGGLRLNLARGRVLHFGSVSLFYNREFERGDESAGGWHSVSMALRPDMVLQRDDGQLLALDMKFKTYAEPGAEILDVRQLHAYRDGIVYGSERRVARAWALFVGARAGTRTVIAYPEATQDNPLGNGVIGAICLRPGKNAGLKALIMAFLRGE